MASCSPAGRCRKKRELLLQPAGPLTQGTKASLQIAGLCLHALQAAQSGASGQREARLGRLQLKDSASRLARVCQACGGQWGCLAAENSASSVGRHSMPSRLLAASRFLPCTLSGPRVTGAQARQRADSTIRRQAAGQRVSAGGEETMTLHDAIAAPQPAQAMQVNLSASAAPTLTRMNPTRPRYRPVVWYRRAAYSVTQEESFAGQGRNKKRMAHEGQPQ